MKKLLTIIVFLSSFNALAHKCDSIGSKVKNGKTYILHKVEKGDGLYSLSKRYNVALKSIVDQNPGADSAIKIDQVLLIPMYAEVKSNQKAGGSVSQETSTKIESPSTVRTKNHTVEAGQTLYTISKKYELSVESIKKLNKLTSDELSEGQILIVSVSKETQAADDKKDKVAKDYDKMKSELREKKYEDVGFNTEVTTKTVESSSGYTVKVEKLVEYDIEKVEETGIVTVGNEDLPNDKNFAFHFNAPIGTVLMVTNPANKSTVFVKVIGNFTKPENSSEILRISALSSQKISIRSKDKVAVSYAR
jgi:LysM repeat protein